MPPTRTPLGIISGNCLPGGHLSSNTRQFVYRGFIFSGSPAEIATTLNLDKKTVRHSIKLALLRNNGASLPRKSRNKSYTLSQVCHILRHVRVNPKDSYKTIISTLNLNCQRTIV
jgi:argininosuccinate synthase